MPTNFSVQIRRQANATVLDLHGDIDILADQAFQEAFDQAASGSPEVVIFNFTDVHYINSTGIAIIVGMLAKARKLRCQLVVYGLSDHYTEIFNLTRLSDFMSIYPDEASALAV